MSFSIRLIFRCSQILWTLLSTALIGNVIANSFAGNPSTINFAIFVCVFSWIACLYGIAEDILGYVLLSFVKILLDLVSTFFTLIAGIVLAARLHARSCGNYVSCSLYLLHVIHPSQSYLKSNHLTNGSLDPGKRCRELQAATAFMWFLFASFLGSLIMDFLNIRKATWNNENRSPRTTQTMSQA